MMFSISCTDYDSNDDDDDDDSIYCYRSTQPPILSEIGNEL